MMPPSPAPWPMPWNRSSRRCRGAKWRARAGRISAPSSKWRRLDEAPALVDRLAPEHLEIATADPEALSRRIRNAGAIFLGRYTPEVIGDYVAGSNHVLPTARSARFASGFGVLDFMKRTSTAQARAPTASPRSAPPP